MCGDGIFYDLECEDGNTEGGMDVQNVLHDKFIINAQNQILLFINSTDCTLMLH